VNILTSTLPDVVVIDGISYPVESDFRTAIRVIMAFEDGTLTAQEKQAIMLANIYPTPPHDLRGAVEQANWFLNGGKEAGKGDSGPRVYSFAKDGEYIFAAFRQTHGVDLQREPLHWWAFLALFMDLGSETTFCQLVSLRKKVKTGKASKEERHAAFEMGDAFDLPELDDWTLEEREANAWFDKLTQGTA
jgi:hypothetical protein